jgi:hypothetical protein
VVKTVATGPSDRDAEVRDWVSDGASRRRATNAGDDGDGIGALLHQLQPGICIWNRAEREFGLSTWRKRSWLRGRASLFRRCQTQDRE